MKKVRYIILLILAAFIIAARINVSVGEWYATHLFPHISTVLSLLVSWISFSMTEVLVVSAVALMIYVLIRNIRRREKVWKIFIKEAEIVAWIIVWFYCGWGINYFRESIFMRGEIDRQPFDEVVFKQFMADYAKPEAGSIRRSSYLTLFTQLLESEDISVHSSERLI